VIGVAGLGAAKGLASTAVGFLTGFKALSLTGCGAEKGFASTAVGFLTALKGVVGFGSATFAASNGEGFAFGFTSGRGDTGLGLARSAGFNYYEFFSKGFAAF